jgi:hypothetical protein
MEYEQITLEQLELSFRPPEGQPNYSLNPRGTNWKFVQGAEVGSVEILLCFLETPPWQTLNSHFFIFQN